MKSYLPDLPEKCCSSNDCTRNEQAEMCCPDTCADCIQPEDLKKLRLQHVEKQHLERLHYYSNREKAIQSPDHLNYY